MHIVVYNILTNRVGALKDIAPERRKLNADLNCRATEITREKIIFTAKISRTAVVTINEAEYKSLLTYSFSHFSSYSLAHHAVLQYLTHQNECNLERANLSQILTHVTIPLAASGFVTAISYRKNTDR